MMHEPPRDIPFYPDWLRDKIGAVRKDKNYVLAITPKQRATLEAEHAAEVREAVRHRLLALADQHYARAHPRAALVDAILADPAIAILVDHSDRRKA